MTTKLQLFLLAALLALPTSSPAETKVKTSGIADGAVTTAKLGADSVTAGKIVDGAVGEADIGASAVGTSEIANGSVGADDLATTLDLSSKTLTLPVANRGTVAQVVNTMTGAVATGTTPIPSDDTIPQNTEGDEYMTLAVTPTSATSRLRIDVVFFGTITTNNPLTVALFQDSTANALAAVSEAVVSGGQPLTIAFTYYMTAGTTSATTFKVRAGPGSAATTTFNGTGGNRRFGGVAASSITITEIRN